MTRKLYAVLAGTLLAASLAHAADGAHGDQAKQGGHKTMHHGSGMHGGGMVPGMMDLKMLPRMADELGLSEAQRTTIKGLMESARPNMEGLQKQLHEQRQKLAGTSPDDPGYAATVASTSAAIGDLTAKLIADGSQLRAQVHKVLTPEQRAKAAELRTERMTRMAERREQMRERRKQRTAPTAQ